MYSVVDISAGPRIQWWLVNECFNKFPVISTAGTRGSGRWMDGMNMTIDLSNVPDTYTLELETKVQRMLAKINIVSYKPPVPYENSVSVPISRLLTMGSMCI